MPIVCDGTKATAAEVQALAAEARRDSPPNLHLVNVQPAFSAYIGHLLGGRVTVVKWPKPLPKYSWARGWRFGPRVASLRCGTSML